MKRFLTLSAVAVWACIFLVSIGDAPKAWAHCQMPCGIYNDPARIQTMMEDAATIKKAMVLINELAEKHDALSLNQATRWVTTKEEHASSIITLVSEYFLTQKVKDLEPGAEGYQKYLETLAAHHRVLRAAMLTKQTVDTVNADKLTTLIEELGKYYH